MLFMVETIGGHHTDTTAAKFSCTLMFVQVNMLRERNKSYGAIKFVDISSKDYSPDDNQGLDYETVRITSIYFSFFSPVYGSPLVKLVMSCFVS
jgi:hypothetical protein